MSEAPGIRKILLNYLLKKRVFGFKSRSENLKERKNESSILQEEALKDSDSTEITHPIIPLFHKERDV